ncbi:MAG: hypothetical protein ACI30L_02460 [Muribaculaceae bacterium]
MKRLFDILLSVSLLAIALAACSDDNEPSGEKQDSFRYDVVTYDGYADGVAQFTFIPRLDAPEITYVGRLGKQPEIKEGQRVLLNYFVPAEASGSKQDVIINGVSAIFSDTLRFAEKQRIDTISREAIRLASVWRTGNYINLHAEVEYTGKPRWFYMLMDKATWNSDTVDCYLVHNTFGATKYFWRQTYASFYVGGAWKKQSCCALRVHINDNVFPDTKTYCFGKQ